MSKIEGSMSLLDKAGEIIATGRYNAKWGRNRLMKRWEKLYGKNLDGCYIQFHPFVRIPEYGADGTNRTTRKYKKRLAA